MTPTPDDLARAREIHAAVDERLTEPAHTINYPDCNCCQIIALALAEERERAVQGLTHIHDDDCYGDDPHTGLVCGKDQWASRWVNRTEEIAAAEARGREAGEQRYKKLERLALCLCDQLSNEPEDIASVNTFITAIRDLTADEWPLRSGPQEKGEG